jgi:hypothetical protein
MGEVISGRGLDDMVDVLRSLGTSHDTAVHSELSRGDTSRKALDNGGYRWISGGWGVDWARIMYPTIA